jgi:hypothetical protein
LTAVVRAPTSTPAPLPAQTAYPTELQVREVVSVWDAYGLLESLELREPGAREFDVAAASETPLLWPFFWCASDDATLSENLTSIRVEFMAGNVAVAASDIREFEIASEGWACHYWVTLLTDWGTAPEVKLTVTYTLSQDLNDGYDDYRAGIYSYSVLAQVAAEGSWRPGPEGA